MDKATQQLVSARAKGLCEYCHSPQAYYAERFQIDHVTARQHGGQTTSDNLALCCLECNGRKGPNIAGVDPETGQIVPLFHPRRDAWNVHFHWRGTRIEGLTAVARATIAVLDLNRPSRMLVRQALAEEGVFPPAGDPRT